MIFFSYRLWQIIILIKLNKKVIIFLQASGYSSMVERRLPKPVMRVRSPLLAPYIFGAIAQPGERYLDMVEVAGSSPVRPTIFTLRYRDVVFFVLFIFTFHVIKFLNM